jgi:hypothetical protein
MRKAIVVAAAVAVALAIFGCAKKPEEPTAETVAPAMTVDDAKGQLKAILEEVETLRAGAEKPSAKLETLHGELTEIEAPETDAPAYAEAAAKVEAAAEGVDGLAALTEMAMDTEKKPTEEEMKAVGEPAQAKFLEACEYAAPELAAKMKAPEEAPTE